MSGEYQDPVSGIPNELLSFIVNYFFPTKHRHFLRFGAAYKHNAHYIIATDVANSVESIHSGSGPEYLMLPIIIPKYDHLTKESELTPDHDVMDETPGTRSIYNSITLELDEDHPVFCWIKHELSISEEHNEFVKGPYLNSKTIMDDYRKQTLRNRKLDERNWETVKKDSKFSPALGLKFVEVNHRSRRLYKYSDHVKCVRVPYEKEEFLQRLKSNKWPLNSISFQELERLLKERVYAVPKPDPNDHKNGNLRWRLSFSVIEVELARSLNEIQRRCYRVLKALIKFDVNEGLQEDRKFPSYFLKTLFFWFCENSSKESWTAQNLGKLWLRFLDSVIESLENNEIPHYFVPSYNLLEDKTQNAINCWKGKLNGIRRTPLEAFRKFWSKYIVDDDTELWGFELSMQLDILNLLYTQLNEITSMTNCSLFYTMYNQWKVYIREASHYRLELGRHIFTYLLSIYALSDFLQFVELQKVDRDFYEMLGLSIAKRDEELIWINLILVQQNPEKKSFTMTCLAEVTHHIALKYGNYSQHCDFTAETAQKFYLIACSSKKTSKYDSRAENSMKYVKYANFLCVEGHYEHAVEVLMIVCQKFPTYNDIYFSRVTSEVLDICLRLELVFQDEFCHSQRLVAYHLLTSCYIHARVLAEVCVPEYVEDGTWDKPKPDLSHMNTCEHHITVKKVLLAFQYIVSGRLMEAFECFVKLPDLNLEEYKFFPYNFEYTVMLFILARLISDKSSKTVNGT